MHSSSGHKMEVSYQLQVQITLSLESEFDVSERLIGSQNRSRRCGEKNIFAFRGIEPRFLCCA